MVKLRRYIWKRSLHLFDIRNQQRHTLLNFCSYVQWAWARCHPDCLLIVYQCTPSPHAALVLQLRPVGAARVV